MAPITSPPLGGCNQGGGRAGAGAEIANRKLARVRALREPVCCADTPLREQLDIEAQMSRTRIDCLFIRC